MIGWEKYTCYNTRMYYIEMFDMNGYWSPQNYMFAYYQYLMTHPLILSSENTGNNKHNITSFHQTHI